MKEKDNKKRGKYKESVKEEAEADKNIRKEEDKKVYKDKFCKKKEVITKKLMTILTWIFTVIMKIN